MDLEAVAGLAQHRRELGQIFSKLADHSKASLPYTCLQSLLGDRSFTKHGGLQETGAIPDTNLVLLPAPPPTL